jgi:histidinol-phosphate aminotransferase
MDITDFVRKNIQPLHPYSNSRTVYKGSIFLDDMESPFDDRYNINLQSVPLNRYPDGMFADIREKLANFLDDGLTKDNIVLGNGSDELINLLFTLFLEEDENVVICPPTFTMYKLLGEVRHCGVKEVPLFPDTFQLDVNNILAAVDSKTKILFLCNPNNPTGTLMHKEDIEKVVQNTSCLVVIDEAYGEHFPDKSHSWVSKIADNPRVIVFRTFSKAWGLAGIRFGYAVASPAIREAFDKIRLPFNIDVLTASVVQQVLEQQPVMEKTVLFLQKEREWIATQLEKLSLQVYPTMTNFLCVKLPEQVISKEIVKTLATEYGILTRDRSGEKNLSNCIRVSVENTREKNQTFITALAKELSK